jgi:hypothetical protein
MCDSDEACNVTKEDGTKVKQYCSATTRKCTDYPEDTNRQAMLLAGAAQFVFTSVVYVYWVSASRKRLKLFQETLPANASAAQVDAYNRRTKSGQMGQLLAHVVFLVSGLLCAVAAVLYFRKRQIDTLDLCAKAEKMPGCKWPHTALCNPSTNNVWQCVDLKKPCPDGQEYTERCGRCTAVCPKGQVLQSDCRTCDLPVNDNVCNAVQPSGVFVGNVPRLVDVDGATCTQDIENLPNYRKRLDTVCQHVMQPGSDGKPMFTGFCGGVCSRANPACDRPVDPAEYGLHFTADTPDEIRKCPLLTRMQPVATGETCGAGTTCRPPSVADFVHACTLDGDGCPTGTQLRSTDGKCVQHDDITKVTAPEATKGCRPKGVPFAVSFEPGGLACRAAPDVKYDMVTEPTSAGIVAADGTSLRFGLRVTFENVSHVEELTDLLYWLYIVDVGSDGMTNVMPGSVPDPDGGGQPTQIVFRLVALQLEGFELVQGNPIKVVAHTKPIVYETHQQYKEPPLRIPKPGAGPSGPSLCFRLFAFASSAHGPDHTLLHATKALAGTTLQSCNDVSVGLYATAALPDTSFTMPAVEPDRGHAIRVVEHSNGRFDLWNNARAFNPALKKTGGACGAEGCHYEFMPSTTDDLSFITIPCLQPGQCYLPGQYMIVLIAWDISHADPASTAYYVFRELYKYADVAPRVLLVGDEMDNSKPRRGDDVLQRNTVDIDGSSIFYCLDVVPVGVDVVYSVGCFDSRSGPNWMRATVRSELRMFVARIPPYTRELCLRIPDPDDPLAPFHVLGENGRCQPASGKTGAREFYCTAAHALGVDYDKRALIPVTGHKRTLDEALRHSDDVLWAFDGTACSRVEPTGTVADVSNQDKNSPLDDVLIEQARHRTDNNSGDCLHGYEVSQIAMCGAVIQNTPGGPVAIPPRITSGQQLDPAFRVGKEHVRYATELGQTVDAAYEFSRAFGPSELQAAPGAVGFADVKERMFSCPDPSKQGWKGAPEMEDARKHTDDLLACDVNQCGPWEPLQSAGGEPVSFKRTARWLPRGDDGTKRMRRECCNNNGDWKRDGAAKGEARCECGGDTKDYVDVNHCEKKKVEPQHYRCAVVNLPMRTPPDYPYNNGNYENYTFGITYQQPTFTYACLPDKDGPYLSAACDGKQCRTASTGADGNPTLQCYDSGCHSRVNALMWPNNTPEKPGACLPPFDGPLCETVRAFNRYNDPHHHIDPDQPYHMWDKKDGDDRMFAAHYPMPIPDPSGDLMKKYGPNVFLPEHFAAWVDGKYAPKCYWDSSGSNRILVYDPETWSFRFVDHPDEADRICKVYWDGSQGSNWSHPGYLQFIDARRLPFTPQKPKQSPQ